MFKINTVNCVDAYRAIKDIPDQSIDLVYTDPPYFFTMKSAPSIRQSGAPEGIEQIHEGHANIKHDLADIGGGFQFEILDEFVRVCKRINIFIWASELQVADLIYYFKKYDCKYKILVWVKQNSLPSNHWMSNVEYLLYFYAPGLNKGFNRGNNSKWYASATNQRDKAEFDHPTIKPLPFVKKHILKATNPGDVVLDPFAGSGTTAVACKLLGRNYIVFEKVPEYCQIIKDRLVGRGNTDKAKEAAGQLSLFKLEDII